MPVARPLCAYRCNRYPAGLILLLSWMFAGPFAFGQQDAAPSADPQATYDTTVKAVKDAEGRLKKAVLEIDVDDAAFTAIQQRARQLKARSDELHEQMMTIARPHPEYRAMVKECDQLQQAWRTAQEAGEPDDVVEAKKKAYQEQRYHLHYKPHRISPELAREKKRLDRRFWDDSARLMRLSREVFPRFETTRQLAADYQSALDERDRAYAALLASRGQLKPVDWLNS